MSGAAPTAEAPPSTSASPRMEPSVASTARDTAWHDAPTAKRVKREQTAEDEEDEQEDEEGGGEGVVGRGAGLQRAEREASLPPSPSQSAHSPSAATASTAQSTSTAASTSTSTHSAASGLSSGAAVSGGEQAAVSTFSSPASNASSPLFASSRPALRLSAEAEGDSTEGESSTEESTPRPSSARHATGGSSSSRGGLHSSRQKSQPSSASASASSTPRGGRRLKQATWSSEEDELVQRLVNEYGGSAEELRQYGTANIKWLTIGALVKGRTPKQCRERWHNLLNPLVNKDVWSADEDAIIVHCIAQGTLVALADGSSVPIERVRVKDAVLSYHAALSTDGCTEAGLEGLTARPVSAVLDQGVKQCVELRFVDERTLTCTPDHRIRTADGRWVEAAQLAIGIDEVAVSKSTGGGCRDGAVLPLSHVLLAARRHVGPKRVYDLSVPSVQGEDTQSFTANGVVVHNCLRTVGTRWSEMARLLPGRTDNAIKNRWYSTIRRVERYQRQGNTAGLLQASEHKKNNNPLFLFCVAMASLNNLKDFSPEALKNVPLPAVSPFQPAAQQLLNPTTAAATAAINPFLANAQYFAANAVGSATSALPVGLNMTGLPSAATSSSHSHPHAHPNAQYTLTSAISASSSPRASAGNSMPLPFLPPPSAFPPPLMSAPLSSFSSALSGSNVSSSSAPSNPSLFSPYLRAPSPSMQFGGVSGASPALLSSFPSRPPLPPSQAAAATPPAPMPYSGVNMNLNIGLNLALPAQSSEAYLGPATTAFSSIFVPGGSSGGGGGGGGGGVEQAAVHSNPAAQPFGRRDMSGPTHPTASSHLSQPSGGTQQQQPTWLDAAAAASGGWSWSFDPHLSLQQQQQQQAHGMSHAAAHLRGGGVEDSMAMRQRRLLGVGGAGQSSSQLTAAGHAALLPSHSALSISTSGAGGDALMLSSPAASPMYDMRGGFHPAAAAASLGPQRQAAPYGFAHMPLPATDAATTAAQSAAASMEAGALSSRGTPMSLSNTPYALYGDVAGSREKAFTFSQPPSHAVQQQAYHKRRREYSEAIGAAPAMSAAATLYSAPPSALSSIASSPIASLPSTATHSAASSAFSSLSAALPAYPPQLFVSDEQHAADMRHEHDRRRQLHQHQHQQQQRR